MARLIEELVAILATGAACAIAASIPWLVDRFGIGMHTVLVLAGFACLLGAVILGVLSATAIGRFVAVFALASILVSVYVYVRGQQSIRKIETIEGVKESRA